MAGHAKCHPKRLAHCKGLCKPCYGQQKYKTNFSRYRNSRYLNEYGISLGQFNEMLARCGSRCEICGAPNIEENWKRLCVDHNHKTNAIRGLLCNDCNQLLGRSKESVTALLSAIAYLEKHSSNSPKL